jgi:hypothetical protein
MVLPPLLLASVVSATTFALAWLRPSDLSTSLKVVLDTFVSYGLLTLLLTIVVAWPIALLVVRCGLLRWWSSVAMAALFGALLARVSTLGGGENPFAVSFSPWVRDRPGFVDDVLLTQNDVTGSLLLGAIVGATFGLVFWLSYTRGVRSNISLQADRER